jgi:hypothetical protein
MTGFSPIPELSRTDADVVILVLHNEASYIDSVSDPWFNATLKYQFGNASLWKSPVSASVMGCTEQYQFCNSTDCTTFSTLNQQMETAVSLLRFNKKQIATFKLLWTSARMSTLDIISITAQDNILLAKDHISGTHKISTALPDNQWQLEAQNFHNTSLALLQHHVINHASPENLPVTPNTTLSQYIHKEQEPAQQQLCKNQKVRKKGFYSFNVFGLAWILSIGTLIIIISFILPSTTSSIRNRRRNELARYRDWEWKANDPLVLLSLALEANNIRIWTSADDYGAAQNSEMAFALPWINRLRLHDNSNIAMTEQNHSQVFLTGNLDALLDPRESSLRNDNRLDSFIPPLNQHRFP